MIDFLALASECAAVVHPTTIAAVVRSESAGNPYAIGINGNARLPRQPRSKAEAIATAQWLTANGYNFDAGLGQINVGNFGWLKLQLADVFEPCLNLKATAQVLRDCYERASSKFESGQPALRAALSCYNTGNFSRGFSNGYVVKVAGNVELPVPALLPIKERTEPLKIQAIKPAEQKAKISRDGREDKPVARSEQALGDAFSNSQPDAFSKERAE